MRNLILLATCFAAVFPSLAQAQDKWRVFVESNVGLATGKTTGEYREDVTGFAADLVLGARLRANSGWVLGASVSAQAPGPTSDICIPASDGRCVASFPSFVLVGIPFGYEIGSANSARFTASPVLARPRSNGWTVGFQGRVDGAIEVLWRISVAASGRIAYIPDYGGDSFRLHAFGVGIRLR